MKNFVKFRVLLAAMVLVSGLSSMVLPGLAQAAGISASGGGSKTVGQSFSVKIVASGAEFDSLQGTISVSGPVTVSVSAGSATWLPGKSPSNGGQFVGIVNPTTSLTVATLTLKGTKEGSGSVTVSGVSLARNGSYVGTSGGSTSFTIGRAPTPPGGVAVASSSHPDQTVAYEDTTVVLSWTAPSNGASGYSYVFDEIADTTPAATANTTETTLTIPNVAVGTHYFHIRAKNGDGWGATTSYKITIKEPDAKVDSTLGAPTISSVGKTGNFQTDITKGTVSGIIISGTGGLDGYNLNLTFDPKDRLPAELFAPVATASTADKTDAGVGATDGSGATAGTGTTAGTGATASGSTAATTATALTPLQVTPDSNGNWIVSFNYPVPSGFYTLTAQSQKDKVLSPASSPVYLEVSVAKGGSVKLITDKDMPGGSSGEVVVLGIHFASHAKAWTALIITIVVLLLIAGGAYYWWRRRRHKPLL